MKSAVRYSVLSQQKTKAILRELPSNLAFHFYEEMGKPTGQVAKSLLDFRGKLTTNQSPITKVSLTFHMKRGDFAAWIKQAIGDSELADKIAKINPEDANLQEKLHKVVNDRMDQLKEALMEYSIIPEDQCTVTRA